MILCSLRLTTMFVRPFYIVEYSSNSLFFKEVEHTTIFIYHLAADI
jgi:hypothetical protein